MYVNINTILAASFVRVAGYSCQGDGMEAPLLPKSFAGFDPRSPSRRQAKVPRNSMTGKRAGLH